MEAYLKTLGDLDVPKGLVKANKPLANVVSLQKW